MGKRYYWLKLQEDFFDSKRVKKLRRLAGGDTFTIIYLKMLLRSIKTDGILTFEGLENTFAEELALDIDEEPDNVQVTLAYLISCGLVETSDNSSFFLPETAENVGSEGSSAQRMRDLRERMKASHCDTLVTERREEKRREDEEIEREGEGDTPTHSGFTIPSVDEVRSYCAERKNNVDAGRFVDYYEANGWKVGRSPMKSWQAAVRNWERSEGKNGQQPLQNQRTYTTAEQDALVYDLSKVGG